MSAGAERTHDDSSDNQVLVGDLLRREGRGQQPDPDRKQRNLVRTLAVAAGVAVLCGAVAVGISALNGAESNQPGARGQVRPFAGITGGRALAPNVIGAPESVDGPVDNPEQPGSGTPGQGAQGRTGNGNGGTGSGSGGQPGEAPGGGTGGNQGPGPGGSQELPGGGQAPVAPTSANLPRPTTTGQAPTSTARPTTTAQPTSTTSGGLLGPILGTLGGFLGAAPSEPAKAYEMLSPTMREGGLPEFEKSWRGVRSASVKEAVADGDNAAKVTIEYVWSNGRKVHVEQRVAVSSGNQRQITEATVISRRGH